MTKKTAKEEEKIAEIPMEKREELRQKSLENLFKEEYDPEDMIHAFSSDPEFRSWSKDQDNQDLAHQMEDDYYSQMISDIMDGELDRRESDNDKRIELAKRGVTRL